MRRVLCELLPEDRRSGYIYLFFYYRNLMTRMPELPTGGTLRGFVGQRWSGPPRFSAVFYKLGKIVCTACHRKSNTLHSKRCQLDRGHHLHACLQYALHFSPLLKKSIKGLFVCVFLSLSLWLRPDDTSVRPISGKLTNDGHPPRNSPSALYLGLDLVPRRELG